jgi:hypothetical protein
MSFGEIGCDEMSFGEIGCDEMSFGESPRFQTRPQAASAPRASRSATRWAAATGVRRFR